ncbi:MAG: sodium ion-translocating decarboxylase subunit beta [Cellulosilyticum sp.]|nr:sodium ion-translocating decarboxylase subunit beta [Cellulosilyticum sp.]
MKQNKCMMLGKIGIALVSIVIVGLYIKEKMIVHEASSIGIIGGADGPTAIFVTSKVSPTLIMSIGLTLVVLSTVFAICKFSKGKK